MRKKEEEKVDEIEKEEKMKKKNKGEEETIRKIKKDQKKTNTKKGMNKQRV